jgi:multidrug efflux system outer membrane protein
MKFHHHAATLLCAALSTGCALAPVYERPAAPVAASYPTGPAYAGAQAGTSQVAAEIGWRDFLVDARLQRLIELGLANNADLRVAMLNVERVRAQYALQRSNQSPQVGADVSAGRSSTRANGTDSGAKTSISAGLSASWELDFFGRLRNLTDAAQLTYLASKHARQAAEILLVSQIADQYLTLVADDALLAVTQNTIKAAQAAYGIVQEQFNAGIAAELDLRLAQTTVDQAEADLAAETRQRAQAENALVLLVGQALPADLPAPLMLDQQALATLPAGLPSELLTRRPDILQAEAALQAENANIGAARAAFFPSISLTGSAGSSSSALGSLFKAGSSVWSFVPALVQPIFNGGANQASLDIARIDKDIGVVRYQQAIQTAFREAADGLAAQGTYDKQLAVQQRNAASQQRRLELQTQLYQSGLDTYQNVLTAQTALYSAQTSLVTARVNQLISQVDLYRALGGGWIGRTGETPRAGDAGLRTSSAGAPR